jgi:hypothetical protein
MLGIFDALMLANHMRTARVIGSETAEIKLNFMSGFVPQLSGAFDDDNRLQPRPFFALVERWQLVECDCSSLARVNAMVPCFNSVSHRGWEGGLFTSVLKPLLDLLKLRPNSRRKVSAEGMPLGSAKKVDSQACLLSP